MPTPFDHITVPSRDLEKSISFYTALGMHLIELEPLHHAHFENKNHHVIFTAYYNENKPTDQVKVYFEIDHLETFEARLRENFNDNAPITFITKTILQPWKGKELHLLDPDGNTVILYEKMTIESIPPWQTKE